MWHGSFVVFWVRHGSTAWWLLYIFFSLFQLESVESRHVFFFRRVGWHVGWLGLLNRGVIFLFWLGKAGLSLTQPILDLTCTLPYFLITVYCQKPKCTPCLWNLLVNTYERGRVVKNYYYYYYNYCYYYFIFFRQ